MRLFSLTTSEWSQMSADALAALPAVTAACTADGRGRYALLVAYEAEGRGRYRVQDDALARYELYRGIDGPPDFDAAPWETFASLPHTSATLTPGHAYQFVLRRRNAWNLVSQNIAAWAVTVDAAGQAELARPSAPDEISAAPAAGGTVAVTAYYVYPADGDDQATHWLVYLRADGVDPDPAVDTPTAVAMVKRDGLAKLNWTSAAQAHGADVRVLVRTRRVGDDGTADSANTDAVSATASTSAPAAVVAGAFFGSIAEQV